MEEGGPNNDADTGRGRQWGGAHAARGRRTEVRRTESPMGSLGESAGADRREIHERDTRTGAETWRRRGDNRGGSGRLLGWARAASPDNWRQRDGSAGGGGSWRSGRSRREGTRRGMEGGYRGPERSSDRREKQRMAGDGMEGWRSNSSSRDRNPQVRRLGFHFLTELSDKEPSVVAITLSSHPGLKDTLDESDMKQNFVSLLCLVLSKAFQSQGNRGTLQYLASIIKDSKFFRLSLPMYLTEMTAAQTADGGQCTQSLERILTVIREVFIIFPASSTPAVTLLLSMLKATINPLRASGEYIPDEIEEKVENLQDLVLHSCQSPKKGNTCIKRDTHGLLHSNDDGKEEQENFRTMSIFPKPEEFHQECRPFLRPNIVSKCYTSPRVYLDTHFRLLREDFMRPLREGIQKLFWYQSDIGGTDNQRRKRLVDDILVYFDTKLVMPICTQAGLAYCIQFDIKPLKFVCWQTSKRLLYGSLVCLSCDNFQNILFATVSDRRPEDLQKGKVQIMFTAESREKLVEIQDNAVFLMVETTAYFEAYYYVLKGLQEMKEENLPFQSYIVKCSTDVGPPAYLKISDNYDLSAIADPAHEFGMTPFPCLEEQSWPSKEKLGLDECQMRALQLALTKEVALIQGPPGTGKTYIGLKIAQALLTNDCLWTTEGQSPILVVCYTNHALDQFLEGIHAFLRTGIVRVGGRSNSEVLKRFNLREHIHSRAFKRPAHLSSAFKELQRELRECEQKIGHSSAEIRCSLKGILCDKFLERFISTRHWDCLHFHPMWDDFGIRGTTKSNLIMEWLGVGTVAVLQRETEDADRNEGEAGDEAVKEKLEDNTEIMEEAALIQEERIIEDDGPRDVRDANNARNREEIFKLLEERMLAGNLNKTEDNAKAMQTQEEWQIQSNRKKKMNKIKRELAKTTVMTDEEEGMILDIWTLRQEERWRLYRLWVARLRKEVRTKSLIVERAYQSVVDRLNDVNCNESLCILQKAKVIGMTTTGAAKYRKVLQEVRPRLIIVEEAAEVLEAHTITTLSKGCQHLILIGDHQQLRPSATVYELGKMFNLEMSMFERLIRVGLPFTRLNSQHRMRPDIACLLTPHIYAELENHPSVMDYDNIQGLNTNLFFVEHSHLEKQISDGRSHQNQHEAEFVVALCNYLLLQGYKPEQITILTTYTGQLHCLRKLMATSQFSGVKVRVVDKYQGEENDIVLLSLVRSNTEGKVGFLSIPNRVCVALSRAKKGLYCIGNSEMLSQVTLWSHILHTLREKGQIGKTLTLCCQNHPERQIKVSCAEDFKQAPEGGCIQPCEFRLDCGHVCARACHPYDKDHKEYRCNKNCQKILCDLGHRCTLPCHEECPKKCLLKLEKIIPKCQHKQMVPCHQDPKDFICQEPCQKTLECGHPCKMLCGQTCTSMCQAKVTLTLTCGHSQQDACYYKKSGEDPVCRTPCEQELKCGHMCHGTCDKCYQGRFHVPCDHLCERLLICSHICKQPCSNACPPCQRLCENCCCHSKCMNKCGQLCAPCIEPCIWQCPHQRCSKLCHEPCDRPPCNVPCEKTLKCGHPCIGLCGETCPSKCRICNHAEVTEILFGTEDEPEAHFIQLEDCGHIFECTAMDKYMGIAVDEKDDQGQAAIKLKECPQCRTPIRRNLRYGSCINSSLAEIEMVKTKLNGDKADIEKRIKALRYQMAVVPSLCQIMAYQSEIQKPNITAGDIWILETKLNFHIRVEKLRSIYKDKTILGKRQNFMMKVKQFKSLLYNSQQICTDQQVFDLQRELQRLTVLTELKPYLQMEKPRANQIQSELQTTEQLLEKPGPFTEEDEERVKEIMEEMKRKVPLPVLGISEEEKKMIVSAMKLRPGHWYKCPNGHVYVITECGGANEQRLCPDCDATIGGTNHKLASGNQVATEMDGSEHPAWSAANNNLDFDLDIW